MRRFSGVRLQKESKFKFFALAIELAVRFEQGRNGCSVLGVGLIDMNYFPNRNG
jgi:hypothetical protein